MTIRQPYFLLTLLLFITEVLIALYLHDDFVRPYVGHTLVVVLIFCFLQSFARLPYRATILSVFLFACFIEWLQYQQLVVRLGLEHNTLARTIIGTSFAWEDIWAYLAGAVGVYIVERYFEVKS